MKKLLLILLIPMIGSGQEWIRIYNNINENFPAVSNIQQTFDSNFIVFTGIGLMKIDTNGDTLWNKDYWFLDFPIEYGIQTSDGGYILSNFCSLYKLDNLGNIQWTKPDSTFFGDIRSIEETNDGGYILQGNIGRFKEKSFNAIEIVRVDSIGNILWFCRPTENFVIVTGFEERSSGYDLDITNNGNYISAGSQGLENGFLAKINQVGDTIWTKKYLFYDATTITSVVENPFGNFVFTGYVNIEDNDGLLLYRKLLIAETNTNGDVIWTKIYEGGERAESYNIEITNDGGYIICGTKQLPNNEDVLWLLKTDSQGDTLWTRTFGNPYGIGFAVKQLPNNGYIITGAAYQNSYDGSIIVIKTNQNGNVTSTSNIPANTNRKIEKTVDLLGRETKGTKNKPLLYLYDDGKVEKRIILE